MSSDPAIPKARDQTTLQGLGWMAVGALVMLLYPFPAPPWGGWMPLIWNWAHAPLFAALGCRLIVYFRLCRWSWRLTWTTLGIILLATTTLVELLQLVTGRSADSHDVLTGMLGGGCGGALAAACICHRETKRLRLSLGLLGVSLALGLLSALPLLERGRAEYRYRQSFPTLETFTPSSHWEFWFAELDGKPTLLPEFKSELQLPIPAQGRLAVHYDAQDRDWRSATAVMFDYQLTSSADKRIPLGIRIDGIGHLKARIRLGCDLSPGSHTASVPLPHGSEDQFILGEVRKLVI
ncbi:MAG TPA: hypothetical protein VK956_12845, partial [Verrucomicrobium sp.]|nr:hypothetical protein [Verrucomicrobium sp.]